MKLTAVLLLAGMLGAHATAFSQKITLSKKAKLEEVLREIERRSGYQFWYEEGLLDNAGLVNIDVKDMLLGQVLEQCMKGQGLHWKIVKQTIVLTREESPQMEQQAPATETISGVVRDAQNGDPLPGASVVLKSNGRAAVTNAKGVFALHTPLREEQLQVTFLGYQGQTVTWKAGMRPLNVLLQPQTAKLNETVITGYSVKKTGELTGAVQKISGDEIRRGITSSDPVSLLKGRATGLYISEQNAGDPTSSGGQIFVRGQSSIVGVGVDQTNEFVMPTQNYGPLLVLDGVIMPNQHLKDIINAQEIADVTILKDAAATAIYGSRAAAGVIVVNTKRGQERQGRPSLNLEVKYGINQPNRGSMRFLSARELYGLQREFYTKNYEVNHGSLSQQYPTLQAYLDNRLPSSQEMARPFNWEKYGFINSHTKEVNLSASGGNEKTRYYVGGTYYDEQSTSVNNGLRRGTFRLNLESRLSERLKASVALNGIFNKGIQEIYSTGASLYSYIPWANPYNEDGTLKPYLEYKFDGATQKSENPVFDNRFNNTRLRSQLIFGSLKLDYRITDWLSFSTTNSANLNYSKEERYIDARSYLGSGTPTSSKGYLGTTTSYLSSFLSSNQLNFHKISGAHSLRLLTGMEFGKTALENMLVNVNNVRAGYPVISLGRQVGDQFDRSIYGIPATKAGNIEGGREERAVYSVFGEAGYTFRERYSLSASLRTDASSSFGREQRYGTFYSAGAAWIVSSEGFMKGAGWISNLKLRANYGTSGSQLGDNFLTNTLYRPGYTYSGQPAALIATLGNPTLRWEVTGTLSTGIDLGLFKRVTLNIDYYRRRSNDLLQKITLPVLSGFPSQWKNVASVQNQGLEVMVNTDNIVRKNFRWSTSFNISFNRNRIVRVANDSLRQGFYRDHTFYLFAGDDINTLKAVKYAGVDPETGKPLFEKLVFDGKGNVTGKEYVNTPAEVGASADTRQFQTIGSFQPKYYGGITNDFSYRQFSLSILITFAYKYIMYDSYAEMYQGTSPTYNNQLAYRKSQRQWTRPGQTDATEPALYYQATTDYFGSSKYMHDGSHARLRNVRLNYSLPQSLLGRLKITGCQVYISGDNLYTLYSRDIVSSDPEGPSVGDAQHFGNSIGSGIAIPRRYMFGAQLTF